MIDRQLTHWLTFSLSDWLTECSQLFTLLSGCYDNELLNTCSGMLQGDEKVDDDDDVVVVDDDDVIYMFPTPLWHDVVMAGENRFDRFLRWQFYLHYIYSLESPIRLSDDDTRSGREDESSTSIVLAAGFQHAYNPVIMLEKGLGHDEVAMIWSASFKCIHLGLRCGDNAPLWYAACSGFALTSTLQQSWTYVCTVLKRLLITHSKWKQHNQ